MLEAAETPDSSREAAEEMEVEEQGEEAMEVEEEMDREVEMEIDPPVAAQARAPHSLSAVRVGCQAGAGTAVGGPCCRDMALGPLVLVAKLPPPRCPEHLSALGSERFLRAINPSLTLSPAGA